jgi:hypothetical protein
MSLLRSPLIVGVPSVSQEKITSSTLYPNPSFQYIQFRFSLKEEATLHFAIYDLSGKLIDAMADAHCERGENQLRFNTAPLPAGQYLIRGISTDGQVLMRQTFVKQ